MAMYGRASRANNSLSDGPRKSHGSSMRISSRFGDERLNVFLDNDMAEPIRKLRKAIQCEVNNLMTFKLQKKEYIQKKQTSLCHTTNSCSEEARKARWESCNPDWATNVGYDDGYNTSTNIDKFTLIHAKKHGLKMPNQITDYDIAEIIGEEENPKLDEVKEFVAKIKSQLGGRGKRRRRSRKRKSRKRRKTRRKRRKSRRKSRRRKRRTKRRR